LPWYTICFNYNSSIFVCEFEIDDILGTLLACGGFCADKVGGSDIDGYGLRTDGTGCELPAYFFF